MSGQKAVNAGLALVAERNPVWRASWAAMKEISPTSRAFTTTPYPAVLAELGRAPTPTGALPHWSNRKTVPARRGWVALPKLSRSRMVHAAGWRRALLVLAWRQLGIAQKNFTRGPGLLVSAVWDDTGFVRTAGIEITGAIDLPGRPSGKIIPGAMPMPGLST